MTKLQKILLISGTVTLLILSSILISMYRNIPEDAHLSYDANSNSLHNSATTSGENTNALNITNNDDIQASTEMDETEREQLIAYINEALQNVNLNITYTEPSEQSFYEHALFYQYVTELVGDRLSLEEGSGEEEGLEEEAAWIAKDLYAWLAVAKETSNFQYDEKEFLSFIDKENFLNEDDLQTRTILETLKEKNETLYVRHLEFHYIKPYIWSKVESDLVRQHPKNNDESEEDYEYRLYLLFQENVTDYLIEHHPELAQNE